MWKVEVLIYLFIYLFIHLFIYLFVRLFTFVFFRLIIHLGLGRNLRKSKTFQVKNPRKVSLIRFPVET